MPQHPALARAATFCEQFNLRVPILMAPMASACPPSLAIAIANAGGLGGCGELNMQPEAIRKWAADVRAGTNGGFQFNLWIPDPPPKRDAAAEAAVRDFLAKWGPPVPPEAGNVVLPDFEGQCDALLETSPMIVSSIMGLHADRFVARMKGKGIKWCATVTTVSEAKAAESAGADAVIAQGMEAGGHRGTSDFTQAETRLVGLFSLVPGVADAVKSRWWRLEEWPPDAEGRRRCYWAPPQCRSARPSCAVRKPRSRAPGRTRSEKPRRKIRSLPAP